MFNPAILRSQQVDGVAIVDGIELLQKQGLKDAEEDLQWFVERVGGYVQILTFLDLRLGKFQKLKAFWIH